MNIRETSLPGVLLLEPKVFRDDRGFFIETFNTRSLAGSGVPAEFVQDNHSRSTRGVVRGLHYQLRSPQGKLVHVARGRIFDVAVDIRLGSPHFGEWFGTELDDENLASLWIPPGFAHGFCVLSDVADVIYKCTTLYDPADDRGILWNDPAVGIEWPVESPIVSLKDSRLRKLSDTRFDLPRFKP
jgi:dTDP-4-dehydrorhamnose 3,5-epimerase